MNMNALRELMDFANKNEMFGQGWNSPTSSYDPRGQRARWAAEMASQQASDEGAGSLFGDDSMEGPDMAYVPPRRMRDVVNGDPVGPRREPRGRFQNFFRGLFETHPYGLGATTTRPGGVRG
jgi:hypothetical protein